jgi:hypothetical protein
LYLLEPERGLKKELPLKTITQTSADAIDIEPFTNRLQKNRQRLAGWLKQNHIECYRVYDADIPEFAVAVDIYKDWAVVQEYRAPKHVDAGKASQRLQAILNALPTTLNMPAEHVVFKQRQKQKGKTQYEKLGQNQNYFQDSDKIKTTFRSARAISNCWLIYSVFWIPAFFSIIAQYDYAWQKYARAKACSICFVTQLQQPYTQPPVVPAKPPVLICPKPISTGQNEISHLTNWIS